MKKASIYIHIPFCDSKCLYCDFASFSGMEGMFEPYHRTLISEILNSKYLDSGYTIGSIFIGGGTPSIIPSYFIIEIMDVIRKFFHVENTAEITIETNPGTIVREKLINYKRAGVNRISLGLQTSQNNLLEQLGRIHTWEKFLESYSLLKEHKFENINVDLMFSLPNQTIDHFEQTLDSILLLKPAHISSYSLTVGEKTYIHKMLSEGKIKLPDDETDRAMYSLVKRKLAAHNYHHYEISNFALDGFECLHNIVYWTRKNYIGFGLGAHSFMEGSRFFNTSDLKDYLCGVTIKKPPVFVDENDAYAEFLFLGLRMVDGVSMAEFEKNFNVPLLDIYGRQIEKLVENRLLEIDGDALKLTARGIDLSNTVFMEFI